MKRAVFNPGDDLAGLSEAVLCRDVTLSANGRRLSLRRGTSLGEALTRLPSNGTNVTLHILVPEAGDITQEEASERLARGIVGEGIQRTEPHQGQVDLRATGFGVLRVDGGTIARLNRDGLALIATGLDGRVVEPDEVVAIVKAAELLAPESEITRLLDEAGDEPLVRVVPFIHRRVALIAGTRIREANLKVSSKHLASGLERFGAELVEVARARDDPGEIAALYRSLLDDGAELILVAGSIVLDPEDPFLLALADADARLVRRGAPIDPGTMFWVAYAGDVPMFGLASCEMYGRLSIFDLFLPYALAGEPISDDLISTLGYGGLLHDTQSARRPASWRGEREDD
jgi:hypothetical protein